MFICCGSQFKGTQSFMIRKSRQLGLEAAGPIESTTWKQRWTQLASAQRAWIATTVHLCHMKDSQSLMALKAPLHACSFPGQMSCGPNSSGTLESPLQIKFQLHTITSQGFFEETLILSFTAWPHCSPGLDQC